jgi:hypothetical protein
MASHPGKLSFLQGIFNLIPLQAERHDQQLPFIQLQVAAGLHSPQRGHIVDGEDHVDVGMDGSALGGCGGLGATGSATGAARRQAGTAAGQRAAARQGIGEMVGQIKQHCARRPNSVFRSPGARCRLAWSLSTTVRAAGGATTLAIIGCPGGWPLHQQAIVFGIDRNSDQHVHPVDQGAFLTRTCPYQRAAVWCWRCRTAESYAAAGIVKRASAADGHLRDLELITRSARR